MRGHAWLYRATNGRIGGDLPGLPSLLLLDTVGAKSGRRYTTPLVYMPDGDDMIVVASKGGYPKHPGWLHHLRAQREPEGQTSRDRTPAGARGARGDERARLWPM